MDFQPVIPEYIRYMDPRLFRPGPMGLTPEQMEMVDPNTSSGGTCAVPKGKAGESRGLNPAPPRCPCSRTSPPASTRWPMPPPAAPGGQPLLPLPGPGDPGSGRRRQLTLPTWGELAHAVEAPQWLFRIDETDYYLASEGGAAPLPAGCGWVKPPGEPGKKSRLLRFAESTAYHLAPVVPGQPFLRPVRRGDPAR